MLGANPRKAGTASTSSDGMPSTAAAASQSDGLMVKAMDEIFRHVEENDRPDSFKVAIIVYCNHSSSRLPPKTFATDVRKNAAPHHVLI